MRYSRVLLGLGLVLVLVTWFMGSPSRGRATLASRSTGPRAGTTHLTCPLALCQP
jgi:hypothetical protein